MGGMAHYNVDSPQQRAALRRGYAIEMKRETAKSRKKLWVAKANAGTRRKKQIKSDMSLLRLESEIRRAKAARAADERTTK